MDTLNRQSAQWAHTAGAAQPLSSPGVGTTLRPSMPLPAEEPSPVADRATEVDALPSPDLLGPIVRPLARLCLSNGITAAEVEHLLRRAFVEEATAELARTGSLKRVGAADLRLSVMSGLHRHQIRAMKSGDSKQAPKKAVRKHAAAALVHAWQHDPAYRDEDGEPADLPLQARAGEASFRRLVERQMSGVPISTALSELVRLGLVSIQDNGYVRLRRSAARASRCAQELEAAAHAIGAIVSGVARNRRGDDGVTLQRSQTASVPAARIPELWRQGDMRVQSFLAEMNALVTAKGTAPDEDTRRVGVYVVPFEE